MQNKISVLHLITSSFKIVCTEKNFFIISYRFTNFILLNLVWKKQDNLCYKFLSKGLELCLLSKINLNKTLIFISILWEIIYDRVAHELNNIVWPKCVKSKTECAYVGDFYETEIVWPMKLTLTVIFFVRDFEERKKTFEESMQSFLCVNAYAYASLCQIFKQKGKRFPWSFLHNHVQISFSEKLKMQLN